MIDYIKPHPNGFIVIYTYQPKQITSSDFKFIRSLIDNHSFHPGLQNVISKVHKNPPIFIQPGLIFYTLPHKQSLNRVHLNLFEIFTIKHKAATCDIVFYSGQRLTLTHIKPSSIKRMMHVLMSLRDI